MMRSCRCTDRCGLVLSSCLLVVVACFLSCQIAAANVNDPSSNYQGGNHKNNKSRLFEMDDGDENIHVKSQNFSGRGKNSRNFDWNGSGREWDVFTYRPPRGGDESSSSSPEDKTRSSSADDDDDDSIKIFDSSFNLESRKSSRSSTYYPNNRRKRRRRSGTRAGGRAKSNMSAKDDRKTEDDSSNQGFKDWLLGGGLPKVQIRAEPQTIIKVRKTLRPLKTILTLGADFNMGLGIWQFKSGWEDPILGGRLTLAGRELQLSKTWLLSVGVVEDLVTRLRLKAAVDLSTRRAYARLGFRTERLSPINVVEGFTGKWMIPLDRPDNKVKLEVKANFAFPEPEIEYSTESARTLIGMSPIEVSLDELNLVLDL